jgi:hypothetical protein
MLLLIVGVICAISVIGKVSDFDKYHLLILAPITLPIIGVIAGIIGVFQEKRFTKLIPLFIPMLNLGLAVTIFIDFSFSYWQF